MTNVRPYRFGTTEATSAPELALALAKHWNEARRDLARGHIARWLENELHDHNLLRTLHDIQDTRGLGEDGKLLRFLLAAAPDLPPVWKGRALTEASLVAAARDATKGDAAAAEWLDTLVRDDVLASYAGAGHEALGTLAQRWREGWEAFAATWHDAQRVGGSLAARAARRGRRQGRELRRPRVRVAAPPRHARTAHRQRCAARRAARRCLPRRAPRPGRRRPREGDRLLPLVRDGLAQGVHRSHRCPRVPCAPAHRAGRRGARSEAAGRLRAGARKHAQRRARRARRHRASRSSTSRRPATKT